MAKISIKRPRIISKKFPEVNSTIDGVEKSLNDLVFSYTEHIDRTLQKKHLMMAISSMVFLIVLGSFISPRGKAESSVFYPDTCLGGWVNPQYAQGEQQTTSNGDESQFTKHNSAVLPKNTNAEMYCGNFKGKFDQATKPTKIIVSLALTKGADLLHEDTIESGLSAIGTSSVQVVASSSDTSLLLATSTVSSTPEAASSTEASTASSTEVSGVDSSAGAASSSPSSSSTVPSGPDTASAVPSMPLQDTTSAIVDAIDSVKEGLLNLFEKNKSPSPTTDTVVLPTPVVEVAPEPVPEPAPAPTPEPAPAPTPAPAAESAPTSYLPTVGNAVAAFLFQKVFAQEAEQAPVVVEAPAAPESVASPAPVTEPVVTETPQVEIPAPVQEQEVVPVVTQEEVTPQAEAVTTVEQESATTTPEVQVVPVSELTAQAVSEILTSSSSLSFATTTVGTTTSEGTTTEMFSIATGTTSAPSVTSASTTLDDNQFQNNFLDVLYTFDGVTWISLGELNEISMKYRTFEIPVTASTSWEDMSRLQVKIVATKHNDDTPTVYLDAIKVEVLYETALEHTHPDFARDTILKDEIVDGVRIVTIINNETNAEEIWYMVLEEAVATSTSTLDVASSTIATTTEVLVGLGATSTDATSTQQQLENSTVHSTTSDSLITASGTESGATSTEPVVVDLLVRKWKKFSGDIAIAEVALLVQAIKQQELLEKEGGVATSTEDMLPDFALDIIKRIKGTFLNSVIIQLQKDGNEELWMYDLEKETEEKIETGTSTSISADSPLGVKGGYIFWLSLDRTRVFAYNLVTKKLQEKELPPFDTSLGERGEVIFVDIPWKVIIGTDSFMFFSEATGEVFSDEDGSVAELLRQRLKLDSVLGKEELSNLNFHVDVSDPVE